MTDQEINIAISELCGWTCCEPKPQVKDSPFARWAKGDEIREFRNLPDFCHDLNAMREAMLALNCLHRNRFVFELMGVLNIRDDQSPEPSDMFEFANATARQRAEAFLLTLGKWQ